MKIKKLKIKTKNLTKQIHFYSKIIGCQVLPHTEQEAQFRIGNSILILQQSQHSFPYHFAINIPSNQAQEAQDWLQQSVPILKNGDVMIQQFTSWNAEALYFYDADKNIVEFIARKNLRNEQEESFDVNALLEISEIGLAVNDIKPYLLEIQGSLGLSIYSGDMARFCAIGGEHGLFICINKLVRDWFPTGDKAYTADFELEIEIAQSSYYIGFNDGKLTIEPIKTSDNP